jgi:bile acid:Na+ symporter, BASS family
MIYLAVAAVATLMISVGMSLRVAELGANLGRLTWLAWVRMLLATFIVPAALALIFARLLRLERGELVGLFVVGAAPGAPLLTRNLTRQGFDLHLAASYQLWASLMVPVMIPIVVAAAAKLYGRDIWISPLLLLNQIAVKQLVPFAAGIAVAKFAP